MLGHWSFAEMIPVHVKKILILFSWINVKMKELRWRKATYIEIVISLCLQEKRYANVTLQREVKAATYTTKWIAIKYHGDGRGVNTWAKWKSSESIPQFSFRMHLQPNLWWIKRDPFRCLPYKRTIACSFSWDKQKRLSRSRRMCKKKGSV